MLVFWAWIFLCWVATEQVAGAVISVGCVGTFSSLDSSAVSVNNQLFQGLNASLVEGATGYTQFVLYRLDDLGGNVSISRLVDTILSNNITAVIGSPYAASFSFVVQLASTLSALKIPFFSPGRGVRSVLYEPFNSYIINTQLTFDDEVEAAVQRVINRKLYTKISLVISSSVEPLIATAVNSSVKLALAKRRLLPHSVVTAARTSTSVNFGTYVVNSLLGATPWNCPNAIFICSSSAKDSSDIIKEIRSPTGTYPTWAVTDIYVLSCGDNDQLVPMLNASWSAILMQDFPPFDNSSSSSNKTAAFTNAHKRALALAYPGAVPSIASARGYLTGSLLSSACRRMLDIAATSSSAPAISYTVLNPIALLSVEQSRSILVEAVFRTSVFELVHDGSVRLGPYGMSCVNSVSVAWNGCSCNSGARVAYYLGVTNLPAPNTLTMIDDVYILNECIVSKDMPTADNQYLIVGQAAGITGSFSAAVNQFNQGLMAAIQRHNLLVKSSGGRPILLHNYNDNYEVDKHLTVLNRLLAQDHVDILAGNLGTPSFIAALPMISSYNVSLFEPITGALQARENVTNVITIRGSYNDEAAALISYAKLKGVTRVASIYINSEYGRAGNDGVTMALYYLRLPAPVASVSYTTEDAATVLAKMNNAARSAPPQAIIFFTTPEFVSQFLTAILPASSNIILFLGSALTFTPDIPYLLRPKTLFSAIMPNPRDFRSPLVQTLIADRANLPFEWRNADIDSNCIDGYITGRMILNALTWSAMDPTQLLDVLFKIQTFNIEEVSLGPLSRPCTAGNYDTTGYQCGCSMALRSIWYYRYTTESDFVTTDYIGNPFVMDSCGLSVAVNDPPCLPGYQTIYTSTQNMDFSCEKCPKGFYGNTTGALSCLTCPAGYVTYDVGSTSCSPCPAGSYQDRSGQTICFPCPLNSYQDAPGRVACKQCPKDTITKQPGSSAVGACIQRQCVIGEEKVVQADGSYVCVACAPGTYYNNETGICISCPIGAYSAESGQSSCKSCLPGTKGPQSRLSQCFQCSLSEYQPNSGASSCQTCPSNSLTCQWTPALNESALPDVSCAFGATSKSNCFCASGYFHDASILANALATGDTSGSTGAASSPLLDDVTKAVNASDVNYCASCPKEAYCCMCPEVAACGVSVDDADQFGLGSCNSTLLLSNFEQYNSPCARCDTGSLKPITRPGYFNASAMMQIPPRWHMLVPCSPTEACLGGPDNTCRNGYSGVRCAVCTKGFYQSSQDFVCQACPGVTVANTLLTIGLILIPVIVGSVFLYNAEKLFRASSLTIAIDWVQTLAIISSYQANWPENIKNMFNFSNAINLKLGILPLSCAFDRQWDYWAGWNLQFAVPFLLIGYCVVLWITIHFLHNMKIVASNRYNSVSTLANTICVCLTISYTSTCKNTFGFFRCIDYDGVSFLADAPAIACYSKDWYKNLSLAVVFAIGYSAGVPIAAFLALYKVGIRRNRTFWKRAFGSLYSIFDDRTWFWNAVLLARRLFLIFCLCFLPNSPMMQMVVSIILLFIYSIANSIYHPFSFTPSNRLAFLCNMQCVVTMLAGIIFLFDNTRYVQNTLVSVVVWITFLFALLMFARGFAAELVGYRFWFLVEKNSIAKRLFDSKFGKKVLFTNIQHWAVAQEIREKFHKLPQQARNQIFKKSGKMKRALSEDILHELTTEELMEAVLSPEFSSYSKEFLDANPEFLVETDILLRKLAEFRRDTTLARAFAFRPSKELTRNNNNDNNNNNNNNNNNFVGTNRASGDGSLSLKSVRDSSPDKRIERQNSPSRRINDRRMNSTNANAQVNNFRNAAIRKGNFIDTQSPGGTFLGLGTPTPTTSPANRTGVPSLGSYQWTTPPSAFQVSPTAKVLAERLTDMQLPPPRKVQQSSSQEELLSNDTRTRGVVTNEDNFFSTAVGIPEVRKQPLSPTKVAPAAAAAHCNLV